MNVTLSNNFYNAYPFICACVCMYLGIVGNIKPYLMYSMDTFTFKISKNNSKSLA